MSTSAFLAASPSTTLGQWLRGSLTRAGLSLGFVGAAWYLSALTLRLEAGDDAVIGFLLLVVLLAHAAATRLLNRQVGAFLALDDAPGNSWLLRLAASVWWVLLLLLSGALILSDVVLLLFALVWLVEPNSGPSWTSLLTVASHAAWA